jgi:arsenate reductase (thioredoxin)
MTEDKPAGEKRWKVLFLCTGNSARSIIAEYLLRRLGADRGFDAFSAGSHPRGEVHPLTLEILSKLNIDASDARSKSWEEFRDVRFDFVITVCDNARESCPVWPGRPIVAHWSLPDPAAFEGPEEEQYERFRYTAAVLAKPILSLAFSSLDEWDRADTTEPVDREP